MTSRATAANARRAVVGVLALLVVELFVPSGAKPWALALMVLAVIVLLGILSVCRRGDQPVGGGRALATGLFAIGLAASVFYLRSVPDAAIPLAGVGALALCVIGLVTMGTIGLRPRRAG